MSTRCNIVFLFGSTKVYLYRHHDGYLADTGRDIAQLMIDAGITSPRMLYGQPVRPNPSDLLARFLAARYEKQSYETEARPIYELTTELHGDIEYAYFLIFDNRNNDLSMTVQTRQPGEPLLRASAYGYTVPEFFAAVNSEIMAMNRRVDELNAEHSQQYEHVPLLPTIKKGEAA